MGSPFYAELGAGLADLAEHEQRFVALFSPWAGASVDALNQAAAPLRFLGALHDLALAEDAPEFQGLFPGDAAAVLRLLPDVIARRGGEIAAFMRSPPQTNEVNRSACLLPGFLTVARETGLPLRLFELGASAGLNLHWDRFGYDFGEAGRWGSPDSPVRLGSAWKGGPPPLDAQVEVVGRRGVDKSPVDIRDPLAARRLRAYVWPDQPLRQERLRGAIDLALASGVAVECGDGADWVESEVAVAEGATTVLYHSVVWQYLPAETQSRIRAAIRRAGEAATKTAPLAWLRMEPEASVWRCELRLDLWPRAESRLLGLAHPHGAEVEWLDG